MTTKVNENTTQRLPQNIARIIKKIKKIKNKQPSPILLAGWWAGWSVGWLARWLVAVSKGILKEFYTNPNEIQPASQPASHPPSQLASQPSGRLPGGYVGVVDIPCFLFASLMHSKGSWGAGA